MRLLASFIVAALGIGPASAQIVQYRQIAGWQVNIDKSLRDGCYIFHTGPQGTVIRIGYNEAREIYWFLAHDAWKSLEVGKAYQTAVSFDGGAPYAGSMRGRAMGGGVVALFATFTDPNAARRFLGDFMRANRMGVTYEGRPVAQIGLQSSHAAGEQLIACQAAADRGAPGGGPPAGGDPFAPRGNSPATDQRR